MEEKKIPLEHTDSSHITRVFQIVLGILCIAISGYWTIYKLKSLQSDSTLWITIIFLVLFGIYQILSGTGKTKKFIETGPDKIRIKQHSVLPSVILIPADIDKIEIYPLSIIFTLKKGGKIKLRFGLTYTDIIQPVKDELILFAQFNNLVFAEINEEM